MPELSAEAKGQWRPMSSADLPRVMAIAGQVHPAFPEDGEIFAERLRLYAGGCLVCRAGSDIGGYVISHPWRALDPPALNSRLGELPGDPETYYLHDLALLPQLRATGAASLAVSQALARAGSEKLATVSLVAVNGSAGFWRRHGFRAIPLDAIGADSTLARKLRGYSKAAAFMVRQL
ncbi:GCN5-related N-acetyltransferase [Nitrobacter winogradskyi Nb-255]|uniref:GCN5-related N-acetyltransferase n=1 Tax=Nitrobacter winogradskyi (strain ATCC 25391 / DSM 10237 / CIP 104748 / NCIMB 11846 / Nb-255) TaxID=323098 RepID=Q3SR14_NITWN|nr:GNAT family N-acetyltransferase [Nitrobacter winogradskyi]ABA05277.1 GCN5-related N-acetyltransferase [Nitrobacter winogradskyi Nb-255]